MTNVLEWLEHMEGQAGEKNCSCRSERKIFLYAVKNVCTKKWNISAKMDDRNISGSNLYGKKLCHIKYYAWSGICRMSVLSARSASAGCETAADSEGAAAGSDCYKGRKSGKNQKLRR